MALPLGHSCSWRLCCFLVGMLVMAYNMFDHRERRATDAPASAGGHHA